MRPAAREQAACDTRVSRSAVHTRFTPTSTALVPPLAVLFGWAEGVNGEGAADY